MRGSVRAILGLSCDSNRTREYAHLELLGLVVARVDGVLALAGLAEQLSAVVLDGRQSQAAIGILHPAAVLPLHNTARTGGVLRVGDGAVVGGFIVTVFGEGVGDAGALGLDELVVQRVVEALQMLVSVGVCMEGIGA